MLLLPYTDLHRPFFDEQKNEQFDVEKILNLRRRHVQYQYLEKWRRYPESEN